ncbi:hypothetical protein A2U01_0080930, partial [Trifolium medium]|nr:hypothetical protein [Trifolium medium]
MGHCNLITALCRRNKVPEEGEDDGELEPDKGLDVKYYHSQFKLGPVNNNQGGNGDQDENEEEGNDHELHE